MVSHEVERDIGDRSWDQYEHDDIGAAVHGWSGRYTVQGAEVHGHDLYTCAIVYSIAFDSAGRLTIEVVSDEGTDPECGGIDFLAQQAIYESAPFPRVG